MTPGSALKAFAEDRTNEKSKNEKIWDLVTAAFQITDNAVFSDSTVEKDRNRCSADSESVLVEALSEIYRNELSTKFRILSIGSMISI